MATKVEISLKTLITVALFCFSLWVILQIFDVIVILIISFIIMSALSPLVAKLERKGLPRGFAVTLVYLCLIAVLGLLLTAIYSVVVGQIVNLFTNFPYYVTKLSDVFAKTAINNQEFFNRLSQEISSSTANIFQFTLGALSGVVSFLTVGVLTFYLLLDEKNSKARLRNGLPEQHRERVIRVLDTIQLRLGYWVRGQLTLSLIVGTLYFLGLWMLGIQNALALAFIAGILEVIPVIGPIIASIPAVIIGLTQAPLLAIAVMALFFIVQQLENHLIVPKVMQRAVGLPPLVILIALLVGGKLFGTIGIILAVPMTVIGHVILLDFWHGGPGLSKPPAEDKQALL